VWILDSIPTQGLVAMSSLVIECNTRASHDTCAFCHEDLEPGDGPRLCLADSESGVCRNCGKRHAPSLVALLDLARTAERVGHIGRHSVTLPLSAMLDLARAAEDYTHTAVRKKQRLAS
jgi:hypothetical protein